MKYVPLVLVLALGCGREEEPGPIYPPESYVDGHWFISFSDAQSVVRCIGVMSLDHVEWISEGTEADEGFNGTWTCEGHGSGVVSGTARKRDPPALVFRTPAGEVWRATGSDVGWGPRKSIGASVTGHPSITKFSATYADD